MASITPVAQPDESISVKVEGCLACGGDHFLPFLKLEKPILSKGTTFVYRYHCPNGPEVLVWMPPDPRSSAVCQVVPAISPALIPHLESKAEKVARKRRQAAPKG